MELFQKLGRTHIDASTLARFLAEPREEVVIAALRLDIAHFHSIVTSLGLYEMSAATECASWGDVPVNVAANVGAYAILAASLPGTQCISFEPASDTYRLLLENVQLNGYTSRVAAHRMALGREGEIPLTASLDTVSHVVSATEPAMRGHPLNFAHSTKRSLAGRRL